MKASDLIELAKNTGFTFAAPIDPATLVPMKEVRDMGNGYKRVILLIADDTIADDLPSWAATGSIAYGIDCTTAYVVDFDGTWSEAANYDLVWFIINSL